MYFSYAMSIGIRYTDNRQDAMELINDGFLKVFKYIRTFEEWRSFKSWFRRIIINTAIDHYRKKNPMMAEVDLEAVSMIGQKETQIDSMSYMEMLELIRQLPPSYRAVFNLHAIEGYYHKEIGQLLAISEGTSKSNYFKAKQRLQELLAKYFEVR